MSAPQIPNLLASRGGPRLRGRGRGRGRGGPSSGISSIQHDQTIQATDTDASVSRLSAVSLGYLDDPYAEYFVTGSGTRRLPIINRGTYARTTALDILILNFLSPSQTQDANTPQTKQIISLGAGTDTRYFRLRAQNRHHHLIYHEFDFPSVCNSKHHIVSSNAQILVGGESIWTSEHPDFGAGGGWGLNGKENEDVYINHPLDLRSLPTLQSLSSIKGLRPDIPTLIISECCLCYLEVETAKKVIEWFTSKVNNVGIVLYEPIGADDAFGKMMVENLRKRGISMPTVGVYMDLKAQRERLRELGFDGDGGGEVTIRDIWEKWIGDEERERVDGLEGLDEVEEWTLLARHYAVVWGRKGDVGFEGWNIRT
ncbi:hypothetical protein B7494_g618 [Chlorociboria aeruginascens]|nr:hypothetical protein B7494_g618 [Chlorociboria aeruginascens]